MYEGVICEGTMRLAAFEWEQIQSCAISQGFEGFCKTEAYRKFSDRLGGLYRGAYRRGITVCENNKC